MSIHCIQHCMVKEVIDMKLDILGNVYLDDVLVLGGNITVTEMLHPVYGVPANMIGVKRTTFSDVDCFINTYLGAAKEDSVIKFKGWYSVFDGGESLHDGTCYLVDLPLNDREMTYKEFIDSLVEIGYECCVLGTVP